MDDSRLRATPPTPLSPDDILDALRDIIGAGQTLVAAFNSRFPSIDNHGLTPFILRSIGAAGRRGISQSDLARQLGRTASSTTRLVDHLEHDGLVSRLPHPSDRRINLITLTPAGETMLADVFALLDDRRAGTPALDRQAMNDFTLQLSRLATIADRILPTPR